MNVGVSEAIPASGSIGIKELAAKCKTDEGLIGETSSTSSEEKPRDSADALHSPPYEIAHLCRDIRGNKTFRVGTHTTIFPPEHSSRN